MKKNIGVIMGGFSTERHISVESGRNVYEKLASSDQYSPIPVFLTGNSDNLKLFILPINILLKDNADDIHALLSKQSTFIQGDQLSRIRKNALSITERYGEQLPLIREIALDQLPEIVEFVFIALHGHPGEDGTLQSILDRLNMPYNGSGVQASQLSMNKYMTNKVLCENGISVPKQMLIKKNDWEKGHYSILKNIATLITYPLIAKPIDEGCSSGVLKINDEKALLEYAKDIFSKISKLYKTEFLVEELIDKKNAHHFLEISCGLLTHYNENEEIDYEMFPPSETLSERDILSLEEKFLAGEGQNITPARFDNDKNISSKILETVQAEIKKVAIILGIEGYARIDAFARIYSDKSIDIYIIEPNTLPGLTPATCIFHQCILHGYKPIDFIHKIIEFGYDKFYRGKK